MTTPEHPVARMADLAPYPVPDAITRSARGVSRSRRDLLRQAWEHAPVAAAVVSGAAHTLVYANAAFRETFGRSGGAARGAATADTSAGRALGGPIAEVFAPGGTHALVALLDAVRRTGAPARGTISTGPAGSADAWQCTAWPVADSDPDPARDPPGRSRADWRPLVVVVEASSHSELAQARHRDLTELVLLSALRAGDRADEADAARLGAEQANQARGRFLATVSHELRTPLAAIGGYAEIMAMGLNGPVTDAQRDVLARIQLGMQHLVGLTTALLHYQKLEAGRVEYTIAPVPVSAALGAALSFVAPQAGAKGVALAILPCDEALTVLADEAKLRQILLNLLANGIKFTASGGRVLLSCAVVTGDAGERVAIRVSDTGCGIAGDQLAAVFDPYVQVGRSVATRDEGVGLGLAISRDLARGMGGELTVESTLERGSTFTLTLPRA